MKNPLVHWSLMLQVDFSVTAQNQLLPRLRNTGQKEHVRTGMQVEL